MQIYTSNCRIVPTKTRVRKKARSRGRGAKYQGKTLAASRCICKIARQIKPYPTPSVTTILDQRLQIAHTTCSPVLSPEFPFLLRATRHPAKSNSNTPAAQAMVHTIHDGEDLRSAPPAPSVPSPLQAAILVKVTSPCRAAPLFPTTFAMRLCILSLNV